MEQRITPEEYLAFITASRDRRMEWFRNARFGMFIHYGLFAAAETGEWAQLWDGYKIKEYEAFAEKFCPKEGCAEEWCRLAKEAGAKYVVLTTRHHEGFSLWNSKVNPFNSYNACGRDIVQEFVDACRKYDLKIGLYSSLMDWRHPDAWKCMTDEEARSRFLQYIEDLNVELLSNYGKIDILWYDMPWPQMSSRNWDSVNRNYKLRQLQPDILINNRSRLAEDFQTPEESVSPNDCDWEACMTFNGISWGYLDEEQVQPYSYSANQVLRMLRTCSRAGGNLLLNIGPKPDGSVPKEAIEPLKKLGAWLRDNGEAAYGKKTRFDGNAYGANQIGHCTVSEDKKTVYVWEYIWPSAGKMSFGGYLNAPKKITILGTGENVEFEHTGHRLTLKNLPTVCPDQHVGITVLKMEFDEPCQYCYSSYYPQMLNGVDKSEGCGNE